MLTPVKTKPRVPKPRDKNDAEAITPPARWVTAKRTPDPGCVASRPVSAKTIERNASAAALDAICAARPLKPPPLPAAENRERSAGAWALARAIRDGSYEP